MNTINFPRLLKLAKHLESGKLKHKNFDFSQFNNGDWKCGSCGCAIGECPVVFPKEWEFRDYGIVVLKTQGVLEYGDESFHSAKVFFGLDESQADHLFVPTVQWEDSPRQDVKKYGGKVLYDNATAKEVAANIRAFVKIMRKKLLNNKVK